MCLPEEMIAIIPNYKFLQLDSKEYQRIILEKLFLFHFFYDWEMSIKKKTIYRDCIL